MIKEALFGFNARKVGEYLGKPADQGRVLGAAVGGLLPLAAVGIHGAVQGAMTQRATDASYQKMLQLYPDLQRESPEKVRMYFDTLASGSPDVATKPLVVGSLLKRMLSYDGFDHSTYMELSKHQNSLQGRSGRPGDNPIWSALTADEPGGLLGIGTRALGMGFRRQ